MDFNPLDILATAALGEKGSSSEKKASASQNRGTSDQENQSEATESKDAEDDSSDVMGKTKHNCINSSFSNRPSGDSGEACDMAPQKLSWSPDAFVSCLDKPLVDPKKLIIEELSSDMMKEKIKNVHVTAEESETKEDENVNKNIENDCVNSKNSMVIISNTSVKRFDPCESGRNLPSSSSENEQRKQIVLAEPMNDAKEDSSLLECNSTEDTDIFNSSQDQIHESGGQSDTDTADTSDSKLVDEISEITCQDLVSIDHSYCLIPGQLRRVPSMENTDDDIDVCSDNSPFTEDSEQRSRNFSLDCSYLKSGILEAVSTGPPDFYKCSLSKGFNDDGMGVSSSSSAFKHVGVISPERQGPKCAKFKIGTFASFSSRNLELEKYLRNKEPSNGKKLDIGIPTDSSFSATTPNSPIYSSVHALLQSPCLDWDRSEAGSETQDDSSDARTPHRLSPDFTIDKPAEWSHPMYHDHDYCNKISQTKHITEESVKMPLVKRKYTKRKTKLDSVNHEKIMKAKYLKKELLKQDSVLKSTPCPLPETPLTIPEPAILKTNPVGRPRKRPFDKSFEEEIDPETGAKMKITGKFQDQYVYYLSKSSRTTSRRRQAPTLPSDKILVPAPKPGDIFVPHLTDADIEIVRQKGRGALNIPDRPHMPHIPIVQIPCPVPPPLPPNSSSELMSDVDSHIVSTILSMESDNLVSPSSSQSPELPHTPDLYNTQSDLDNLRMINSDSSITSDHVLNYLLSGVKDDEHSENLLQSSASLFPALPSDPLYSKAGHMDDTDLNQQGRSDNINQKLDTPNFTSKYLLDQCSSSDSDLLPSDSAYSGNSFDNSASPSKGEHGGTLPDDLSTFISHSQVATTSSTTQCSIKSVFSPDLGSLDTPQLSASVPRLTSIEKTLDFLGVKDGEIKLENDSLFASKTDQEVVSSPVSTTDSVTDDTPWIVTVTLYFNDVPAIMVNNTPFIRLVDIHKQILPAKDTGILKKRCQLLNIPVLNCTEMQRYFLVQYGRAYNSKSTLIVSKEQANILVTYYAMPQPRIGRSEEAHVRRQSCSVSSDGSNLSPVETSSNGKKRGNIKNRKSSMQNGVVPNVIECPRLRQTDESSAAGSNDQSLNKRTRHKKINYLEMLKGEEKEKSTEDSILETIEAVVRSYPDIVESSKVSKEKSLNVKHPQSKKKLKRSVSDDSKIKDTLQKRKKAMDNKKKRKGSKKGERSAKEKVGSNNNKVKGSSLKLFKKCDKKVIGRFDEITSDYPEIDPHSNKSKFKPLKLKVNSLLNFAAQRKQVPSPVKKSGLFSRSNSSTSTSDSERPLRVLAVAHQASFSLEHMESHLPSQPADIHLDLFTKSSSACVQCHTCSQFLSVPHFMRHHHVPMDNEWLATESAHRILVPRNKENISEVERKLWEEFHRLQEAIGGFGEGDDDSDGDDEDDDDDDDDEFEDNDDGIDEVDQQLRGTDSECGIDSDRSHSISLFPTTSTSSASLAIAGHTIGISNSLPHMDSLEASDVVATKRGPSYVQSTNKSQNSESVNAGINSKTDVVKHPLGIAHAVSMPVDRNHGQDSVLHVRTSSRKRKSKQLFSIENYCTPSKKGVENDGVFQSSASG